MSTWSETVKMTAMKLTALAAFACATVLGLSTAVAQTTDDAEGDEVELGEDPIPEEGDFSDDPSGMEENPGDPVTGMGEPAPEPTDDKKPVAQAPAEYPIERALRPLTLPERMTEITFALPNTFNPYVQNSVLGAHHGITDQIEAGLRYGTGTLFDGEFFAGKAFALDVQYKVFEWLSGQLSLPFLVDPFAMAVTLGAPVRFTFGRKLAVVGGADLLTFKITRFIPSVENAALNDALVAADEVNTNLPEGELNLNGGVIYQHKPNIALDARIGLRHAFESESDQTERDALLFDVGVLYSTSNKVDVGARAGFLDLNNADSTFGISLLAALRI